jgi:hypothetical protein
MPSLNREDILKVVRELPPEQQRALALEILQALAPTPAVPVRRELPPDPDPRASSAMDLRGIAKTDAPIDDMRALDESRLERYS